MPITNARARGLQKNSGTVPEASEETWGRINSALKLGYRDLPGESSLSALLTEHRERRHHMCRTAFSVEQILGWADAYHKRTGEWPTRSSGASLEAPGETWNSVTQALFGGWRGLPRGVTLPQLLNKHRGKRNRMAPVSEEQILAWADAYHQRTGKWPAQRSGPVKEEPGEKWVNIDVALAQGGRGLPGGSSLAKLIAKHRRQ